MSVNSTNEDIFYKNVYLLSQAVPTTKEFKSLFSKSMFRKHNTPGFLHVSQFLLNIYDAKLCKDLIPWPCMDKKDETNFRKNMIEFLKKIEEKNADFPFPSGVPSCLFQASGTKFMIIMRNLSIIVLRSHVRQNVSDDVYIPFFSLNTNKQFFQDLGNLATQKVTNLIENFNKDKECGEVFVRQRQRDIEDINQQISEKKKVLSSLVEKAQLNNKEDKKKLADPQKNEQIIESWRKNISESMDYLQKSKKGIQKIDEQLKNLSKTVDNVVFNPVVLDVNALPRINIDGLSQLLDPESQIVARRLYENEELVLTNFFVILEKIVTQFWNKFQQCDFRGINTLCEQLKASSEDLQIISKILQVEWEKCVQLRQTVQPKRDELFENTILPVSPICVQKLSENQKMEHEKKINLTPVLSFHDQLFSKYKSKASSLDKTADSTDNQIVRVNFDDTLQSFKNDVLSARADKTKKLNPKDDKDKDICKRYSLFFTPMKKNKSVSKLSNLSTLPLPKANSTVMTSITEVDVTLEFAKSRHEAAREIAERTLELPKLAVEPPTKVEPPTLDDQIITEIPEESAREEKPHSRRSITDLVERYKNFRKGVGKSNNDPLKN